MTAQGKARRLVVAVACMGSVGVLGVGIAFGYFSGGTGSGSGSTHVAMTVNGSIGATTGAADLYPGGTGAAYFTLTNTYNGPMSFNQVTAASVHSNSGACSDANVSIAPTLPYNLSTPVTVGPNTTSGTQSVPALVRLASGAPNGCQGASFTVTLTLSGTFG